MTTLSLAKTATTPDLLKGHKSHTVGSHSFIQLSVDEFLEIQPIPTNRDSVRRVPKMKNTFIKAYAEQQENTLTEVAIGIVAKDFEDQESQTKYLQGQWFVVDGNTRQHFWRQFPDYAQRLTNGITAKIHYLQSMKDVEFAYYPYNNAKSVEKASEILHGLARRYNWAPRQQVFNNGGYKSALDWAAFTPGEDKPDVFKAFHICFEALKILDTIPKDSKNTITNPFLNGLKSQAIIAACLFALRQQPQNLRLHDLIARLATITDNEINSAISKGELDAVQIIAVEYTGNSPRRTKNMDAEPWLRGLAKSTKFESQMVQMDFLIYWIQKYIESPNATWNFKQGVRSCDWQGAWYDSFPGDDNE